jgi:NADH:ubiquinone oxidoreductase subunit 6 (subunit J)
MLETIAFWALADRPRLLRACRRSARRISFTPVLWLALALTGTAGIFLLLNAEFLAAVQLLLYAGGHHHDRRLCDCRHRAARW